MPSLSTAFHRYLRSFELFIELRLLFDEVAAQAKREMVIERRNEQVLEHTDLEMRVRYEARFSNVPEVPERARILLGDIVHSTRGALDYLVAQVSELDSGGVQPQTQFLTCDSNTEFAKEARRRLRGLSPAHVAMIEAVQPYNPGGEWTKWLRDFSNRDKHNDLVIVASGVMVEPESLSALTLKMRSKIVPVALKQEFALAWSTDLDGRPIDLFRTLQKIGSSASALLKRADADFPTHEGADAEARKHALQLELMRRKGYR
jgi:hypothetical protein